METGLKIYFASAVRSVDVQQSTRPIIEILRGFGKVLTEHIPTVEGMGDTKITDEEVYKRDLNWLYQADIVVANVSIPSLGVGYEIGIAEKLKPVVCIFDENSPARLSAMISGNANLTLITFRNIDELERKLSDWFLRNFPKKFVSHQTGKE
ncbi:MAG: nucleoside 2-deoxyribosyltransferase [Deltaproteobacteria bacterium]|nr:nucleoside 2-deoxyribosyltransferase [Deltaproteobacteria bacterium]